MITMYDNLKNVVLDLGGVLYDIDPEKTFEELSNLFEPELSKSEIIDGIPDVVHAMETGRWTDEYFICRIKEKCKPEVTEDDIINAWNKILIKFPEERISMVKNLASRYRLFLLSNTNSIHIRHFEDLFIQNNGFSMHDLFEKIYYSSEIGMRKPDIEAFRHVLIDSGLKASETIMIDDRLDNCLGAESAGMKFLQVPENTGLEEVIDKIM